ncbi:single-stranded-DNA-specific exonuclease RecJ [Prolixibacter bellariivorans]|uniref:Single-stranded-DNA-specific exonuclease RecJ n=1 Tax=Prolixibacter bellariivorans TaxID=314319 RepID=A0A5M4AZA2_9BACT|nr:single-stranded-DNA-specific exonuclease RecJ [Prolixibacter bellariivorans]GET33229.1 single-stranded-DNA-specific exonuclease RecJ [Prolixibacter bellariivorans]
MQKIWNLKQPADMNEVKHLSAALNVDMAIANLLVQRGIKTYQDARSFFRPRLSDLHDPFLMKDMDKAVKRLVEAIQSDEKVLVYGDYDVDGTTSVALMYSFLQNKLTNVDYYIPDRYMEGYGISKQGIEYAAKNNYSLVVVLDCGIKAIDKIAQAKEMGVEFIICDHHNPGDEIPGAVAVLDPKQPGCNYPYKELSGCGVGFKFVQAFCRDQGIPEDVIYELLDLVVVSIASDIVPLTGENRVLAYYGLRKLNSNPSIGLKTLIKYAGMQGEIRVNDIVFRIGPRLNASGRIEHGKKSVAILMAQDEEEAEALGSEINSYNEIRKTLDQNITQEALEMIQQNDGWEKLNSTVLYNRDWHKGVVGIVASRLTEHYYRPTIILTESNGMATGSARSVGEFDLYEAVGACADLLESYGGHMYAAGMSMKIENVPEFRRRFEEIVTESVKKVKLVPTIDIDAKVSLSDLNPKFLRVLNQFEPFGPHNMMPVFLTEDVMDYGTSRLVGKGSEHIKLDLIEANRSSSVFSAIAFSQSQHFEMIKQSLPFDICYSVTENEYRGKVYMQLNVRDMRSRLSESNDNA